MRYSTRTRYGLRFLNYLGKVYETMGPERVTQLSEVAEAEDISLKYLEQIVRKLKPLVILSSVRGVKGGYRLRKHPSCFHLDKIFDCLEGTISPVPCVAKLIDCPRLESCSAYLLWQDLDKHVRSRLESLTLADIMFQPEAMPGNMLQMRETANT